jgi:hypothetical protein
MPDVPMKTVATAGVTVIVATAGPLTVTGTDVLMVESSAIFTRTVAVPFAIAVTLPNASTLAIAVFDEDHVTDRDPFGLRSVAVIFADCPSSSVSAAGETSTAGGSGLVESQATAARLAAASTT